MDSFKFKYDKNDSIMKYLSENPIGKWSYLNCEAAINKSKPINPNPKKLKNAYLNALKTLKNTSNIPKDVKKEIDRLLSAYEEKASSITFNISAKDSSTVNAIGTGVILPPCVHQGSQLHQVSPLQPEDENEDDSCKDETRIPSDLSIDHHPRRTSDYAFSFWENSVQLEDNIIDDAKWVVDNHCISDLCFQLKDTTVRMINQTNPAQLSDIRLLALNDVYLLDRNIALSSSKYFTAAIHNAIKASISFEAYLPIRGAQCYDWCTTIGTNPPSDWISSLAMCGKMLSDACESKNLLDIHTAQVLTHILPIFINGPPDCSIEDSYVHNYLSPLLSSVFGSDSMLNIKWANGQLKSNDSKTYKPDFSVFNLSGNTKCVVLIAEFKNSERTSCVESDLVKLAKQMKSAMNSLVSSGVVEPKICGIHCKGDNLHTYVMELLSPKVYGMINIAKSKLFGDLDQITLLPTLISHLMSLKNIALETAYKVETAFVSTHANLKRPAPTPPLNWLSKDSFALSRLPKKQKK
ncbi:hypothetical protein CLU79DRAFT_777633 [Phycomyces nitens]|nr:hypothetical protein CLU79DRAFT_777633 [Phycomyces nitens]